MTEAPWASIGTPVAIAQPAFVSPLELEYIDGKNWRVIAAFDYESGVLGEIVMVPAGFVTDFASTPRALWWLLPPTGPWGKPSVIHDLLYRTKGLATKDQADLVFLEAMTAIGVGQWTREIMFIGVSGSAARPIEEACETWPGRRSRSTASRATSATPLRARCRPCVRTSNAAQFRTGRR